MVFPDLVALSGAVPVVLATLPFVWFLVAFVSHLGSGRERGERRRAQRRRPPDDRDSFGVRVGSALPEGTERAV